VTPDQHVCCLHIHLYEKQLRGLPRLDRVGAGWPYPNNKKGKLLVRRIFSAGILLLLAALIAGCGESTVTQSSGAHPTGNLTATAGDPTATATPAVTPATLGAGHQCINRDDKPVSLGDLHVTRVIFEFSYPSYELPAPLDSSKPFPLPANIPDNTGTTGPVPPVNPNVGDFFGYELDICNTSASASHVINAITVGIAAFTPYSGQLNTWNPCSPAYQRPNGVGGGGCGGGGLDGEGLHATFAPNASTGAQVTAAQVSTGQDANGESVPPLPIKLGPGQRIGINLGLTPPTALGMYTFAFALGYDNTSAAPISTMPPTLFDSAAIAWSGSNCDAHALLAQIPTSDTQNRYVCA